MTDDNALVAIAEQLRIANLIAYKQLHTARRMNRNERTGDWEVDNLPIARDNITDEIDRVLDLEHLGETPADVEAHRHSCPGGRNA